MKTPKADKLPDIAPPTMVQRANDPGTNCRRIATSLRQIRLMSGLKNRHPCTDIILRYFKTTYRPLGDMMTFYHALWITVSMYIFIIT